MRRWHRGEHRMCRSISHCVHVYELYLMLYAAFPEAIFDFQSITFGPLGMQQSL